MKTIFYQRTAKVPRIFLLLFTLFFVGKGWGQQVIGSFPVMDGGFEAGASSGALTNTTYGNGTQGSVWTTSVSGQATFQTTSPRTGLKFVNCLYTTNSRRLQSPTAPNGAIVSGTNNYTVQYYYRTAGAVAPGGTTQTSGISADGTNPLPSMSYTTLTSLAATSNVWTKVSFVVSGISSTNPSPQYGILTPFRTSAVMAAGMDIDDVCMYLGAADVTAPDAVTLPTRPAASATQQTISWTAPVTGVDGGGYIVVRGIADPTTAPNVNGIYQVGNTVNTGEQVVYLGTNTSFIDLGLTPSTTYYYRIYTVDKAFNYSTATTISGMTTIASFAAEPTAQVTGLNLTSVTQTGFTINWTNAVSGGGTNHLVIVKASSAISGDPLDGSSYTANTILGSGSAVAGGTVVYNGAANSVAVTGLSKGVIYYVRVYDFNGTGGSENYFITNPTSGIQQATPGEIVSNGTSPSGTPKSYSDASAWVGGATPTQFDNVTIGSNDFFNIGSTQRCNNLTIQSGAKLSSATAQSLQIYGTSLVCDGTLGDPSIVLPGVGGTGSALSLDFGGNLTISGSGGIYPNRTRPITGLLNVGVTFASNATLTNLTAGTLSDNTGNDNISFTVNNGVTLNVAGNMNTTSSSITNGTANTTFNINGTVNVIGNFCPIVTIGKTCTVNVNGLLNVNSLRPNVSGGTIPNDAGGTSTIIVNTGGEFRVTSSADFSGTAPATVSGLGTFTLPASAAIFVGASTGLNPTTGSIRTTTRSFNTAANYNYSGTATQPTGSDLPATVNNLIINNTAGVSLSSGTTVNGALTFTSGILTTTTPNILTLGTSATVSGAGAGKFVSGPMIKLSNTATPFIFPVGKAAAYRPATISPYTTASSSYSAEYFNTAHPTTTLGTSTGVSASEYWDVTRNSGASASVGFNYDNTFTTAWSGVAPGAGNSITVSHLVGGLWQDETGNTGTVLPGSATSGMVVAQVLSTFSPFTFGTASVVLPVTLLDFKASIILKEVSLTWKVTNESSLKNYEIERSVDGIAFTTVGKVAALNSSVAKTYDWKDINPNNGLNLYRLKITNLDGSFKYSSILRVDMKRNKGISIYPNPIRDNQLAIQMNGQEPGVYAVNIFSAIGQRVFSTTLSYNGVDQVRIVSIAQTLTGGHYFVEISNNKTTKANFKIVVQ